MTFGAGGWAFTLILLAFFVPSVALSRVGRARKKKLTDIGKGGARDAWQVLANGGVATMCAVAAAVRSETQSDSVTLDTAESGSAKPASGRAAAGVASRAWIAAFAGAYAAATADTWGTEIGTLARGRPRSILSLKPIGTGLSGGVTLVGCAAEIAGAVWTGACAIAALRGLRNEPATTVHDVLEADISPTKSANPSLDPSSQPNPSLDPNSGSRWERLSGAIVMGGIAGAFVDSLLGATVQELRWCPECERNCETNPHACGTSTTLVRGVSNFSNDLVNFAATLSGASTAFILAPLLQRGQRRHNGS